MRVLKVKCPECGAKAVIRKTNPKHPIFQIFIAPVRMWSADIHLY